MLKLDGKAPEAVEDSEDTVLLQKRGDAHEAAHLEALKANGDTVLEIETDGVPFEQAVVATIAAMKQGPKIIFKGALEGELWGGYSDFLEQIDTHSNLGDFSYEVREGEHVKTDDRAEYRMIYEHSFGD